MPADLQRLLSWEIPAVRQTYDARDTAFYALSIGVGQDPHDRRAFELIDPWSPRLQALPTMILVLGYPGFWLGDPAVRAATGVAGADVLHVEQTIALSGPLPASGDVIGRTRVLGLVDKGPGKHALLHSERVLTLASDGALLGVCSQVHFLRGHGGFSRGTSPPFVPPPPHPMPDAAPSDTCEFTTRPEQALLYRLNGDANPLHLDPEAAQAAGLPRPILHGMCTMAIAAHLLIAQTPDRDPARLQGLRVRMSAPVFPGDTLAADLWPDGSFRVRALERDIAVIGSGHAMLR